MKYLVGYSPDQGGREALALAAVLARSCGGALVVCTVIPETWGHPSMARVDAEYAAFLETNAKKALAKAKAALPKGIEAQFITRAAPSGHEGLEGTAADVSADCIVLGSARKASLGRFAEGHVTSALLRSARVPVALAPRGYAPPAGARIKRLTCAFSGADESFAAARRSAEIAGQYKVPLRLATFVVRDKQMYPTGAGYDAENMVSNQMRRQAQDAQARATANWAAPVKVSTAIGDGRDWKTAIASIGWENQEVMAVGSSGLGPILRVFVGSNSGQILHNAATPVLMLPRHEA